MTSLLNPDDLTAPLSSLMRWIVYTEGVHYHAKHDFDVNVDRVGLVTTNRLSELTA